MYDKQRTLGQAMPCEAEFRAYHLLTLIGTHGRYRYDATEYQGALAVSTVVALRQILLALIGALDAVRMQNLQRQQGSQRYVESWVLRCAATWDHTQICTKC